MMSTDSILQIGRCGQPGHCCVSPPSRLRATSLTAYEYMQRQLKWSMSESGIYYTPDGKYLKGLKQTTWQGSTTTL